MINRRLFFATAASALAASCARKESPFAGLAFVANEDGRNVTVVDLAAFAVVRQIALGGRPAALLSHENKPLVYSLAPDTATLYELDAAGLRLNRHLNLGGVPIGMARLAGDDHLWVLCRTPKRLIRIDLAQFRVSGHVALPLEASAFDLGRSFADGKYSDVCAVAYGGNGAVGFVEFGTGRAAPPHQISQRVGALRLRNDGKVLIAANPQDSSVSLIEAPSGRVISYLPLAIHPAEFCVYYDGGQVFVTGEGRDAVVILYPYHVPEVAETILAGRAPGAMASTESFLFVANPTAGGVTIVEIASRKVIAVTGVGSEPRYITVTPQGQFALVLNQGSGDMAVIRTGGIKQGRAKTAALFTMIPVGSKPVCCIVRPA